MRWLLLSGCAGAGGLAVVVVVIGLGPSALASRGWTLIPDAIGPTHRYVRLQVHGRPPLRPRLPGFYWRGLDGRLQSPHASAAGVTYLGVPPGAQPGPHSVRSIPNPYGSRAPAGRAAVAYLLPRGSEIVVLDARAVLAMTPDGRLAPDAGRQWLETSSAVPLLPLAEARPLAYLVAAPLADYRRARSLLARGPLGAVLAASSEWESTAADKEILDTVARIAGQGMKPVLITEDAALARRFAAARRKVICVGDPPDMPPGCVTVRQWSDAPAALDATAR